MRFLICCLFSLFFLSCIPISIAPTIEGDKLVKAKRFKRSLPKNYGFVFEDPKDADEFYNFINSKYDLDFVDVETNVPVQIDNDTYFLSFFEREKVTRTLNLIPLLIDAGLQSKDSDPIMEDLHTSRMGKWYIILIVEDSEIKDCLSPEYTKQEEVISFLKDLQSEYLSTYNYVEAFLKE